MSSYPTRNRKLKKNSKKIQNTHFDNFSSQNKQGKAEKEKEKKNRYDEFLPNP